MTSVQNHFNGRAVVVVVDVVVEVVVVVLVVVVEVVVVVVVPSVHGVIACSQSVCPSKFG
mgnify:CR=1 FL=1